MENIGFAVSEIERRIHESRIGPGSLEIGDFVHIDFGSHVFDLSGVRELSLAPPVSGGYSKRLYFNFDVLGSAYELSSIKIRRISSLDLDLGRFPNLYLIDIASSDIPGVRGLEFCRNLRSFSSNASNFSGSKVFQTMQSLRELSLMSSRDINLFDFEDLHNLIYLDVGNTDVDNLKPLLAIPAFYEEKAKFLSFRNTPVALSTNPLTLLSGMRGAQCAVQTVQYLKGMHPNLNSEFNPSKSVAVLLEEVSPLEVKTSRGKISLDNPSDVERYNPVELEQRVSSLRSMVDHMINEVKFNQCPHVISRNLMALKGALINEAPIYFLIENHAKILEAILTDEYEMEATNAHFVTGLRQLVLAISEIRPLLMPPSDSEFAKLRSIPDLSHSISADDFIGVAASAKDALTQDELSKDIDSNIIDAIENFTEKLQEVKGKRGVLKTIAAKFSGFISLLSDVATIHQWFVSSSISVAVVSLLQRLAETLVSFFNK